MASTGRSFETGPEAEGPERPEGQNGGDRYPSQRQLGTLCRCPIRQSLVLLSYDRPKSSAGRIGGPLSDDDSPIGVSLETLLQALGATVATVVVAPAGPELTIGSVVLLEDADLGSTRSQSATWRS